MHAAILIINLWILRSVSHFQPSLCRSVGDDDNSKIGLWHPKVAGFEFLMAL